MVVPWRLVPNTHMVAHGERARVLRTLAHSASPHRSRKACVRLSISSAVSTPSSTNRVSLVAVHDAFRMQHLDERMRHALPVRPVVLFTIDRIISRPAAAIMYSSHFGTPPGKRARISPPAEPYHELFGLFERHYGHLKGVPGTIERVGSGAVSSTNEGRCYSAPTLSSDRTDSAKLATPCGH